MAMILFEDGKRIGEISDWKLTVHAPVYKNILGKEVLSGSGKEECTFTSPKPVARKSKLMIVEDGKKEIHLESISVKGGTFVMGFVSRPKGQVAK